MIKTLLFDADDTLFDFAYAEDTALQLAMEHAHIPYKKEYLPIYSEINLSLWHALERGEITKPELFDTRFVKFLEAIGVSGDAADMRKHFPIFLGQSSRLFPESRELLHELSGAYDIYIITNGAKEAQQERFSRTGIDDFLKGVFVSEDLGYEKPGRGFFDCVAAAIPGFSREQAVVIGDSLTSDIKGGVDYGITTVWYNRKHKVNTSAIRPDYEIAGLMELPGLLSRL